MPADVHDIFEHQAHLSGPAVCLACRHSWVAVAPLGTTELECGSCGLFRGIFAYPPRPSMHYECQCGNSTYYIGEGEIPWCTYCGLTHTRLPSE